VTGHGLNGTRDDGSPLVILKLYRLLPKGKKILIQSSNIFSYSVYYETIKWELNKRLVYMSVVVMKDFLLSVKKLIIIKKS
jgi:hypothetical protein